ncbi:FeoA family protein [Brachybacterium sp. Marseille-Q7125]|uniref:FeoA family protein n=1 Tax=Brachybacterium sp. Marseille-Q7125 TaxID=2932815 RepID=UPI001FF3FEC0|nr:FeoA family protein [Brachybacterium sp. Marseille-Q7125]
MFTSWRRIFSSQARTAAPAGQDAAPSGQDPAPATVHDAPLGAPVVLATPGCPTALRLRLAELGLRCGQCVCPLQRTPGGGRVIEVGDTRLALDRATCRQLLLDTAAAASPQDRAAAAAGIA